MKKTISFLLVALICIGAIFTLIPTVKAEAAILNPSYVKGSDFTDSEALANMLDVVFSGDIDIYTSIKCSNEVQMPMGTTFSKSNYYYVKSKTSGTVYEGKQCYIYANAVYNKLFNEVVYHGGNLAHSRVVISGGSNSVSYDTFKKAGVRCGAYIRTTGNSSGKYDGNIGHSMIVLSYDENYIYYFGGNQAGGGEIDIRKETWSEFNKERISGIGRYIAHVVQPTDAYYDSLYPSHKCTDFEGLGVCTNANCGKTYDWQSTFDNSYAGKYKVIKEFTPRTNAPYSAANKADYKIKTGNTVNVEGVYTNAFDYKWIKFTYNGEVGYVLDDGYLELTSLNGLNVTCSGFTPEENAQLPVGLGYPVYGTVSSNYPLKKVVAKLDGNEYAAWTASNDTTTGFNINPTDINNKLKFGSLSAGKHTVTLIATDIHGRTQTFLTRNFYMVTTSCSHTYDNACDTTCNKCGATRSTSHSYTNACDTSCNTCGATRSVSHEYTYTYDSNDVNSQNHWEQCTICGDKKNEEPHTYEPVMHNGTHMASNIGHYMGCYICNDLISVEHVYDNDCDNICNICNNVNDERNSSHSYTNACDTTCNVCGETRAASHNYEYSKDTTYHWKECTICGIKTESERHQWELDGTYDTSHSLICKPCKTGKWESHKYDNACDKDCNVCESTRTTSHEYDNACDTRCNNCDAVRVTSHKYDNACDTSCNVCGATRTANHKYSNACDKTCDVCGAVRTVSGHVYDNDCDTSCNNCGYSRSTSHRYDNNCDSSCNVCGAARTVSHSYGSKYQSDENTHWRSCSLCGHKGYVEEHIPGSAATESKPQICLACEYVIQAPLGHAHKPGNTYESDSEQHWQVCTDESCRARLNVESHVFDNGILTKEPTTDEMGEITFTCVECGEIMHGSISTLPDTPSNPEGPGSSDQSTNIDSDPSTSWVSIIVTVLVVGGIAAVAVVAVAIVIIVFVIKKKPRKVQANNSESNEENDSINEK